MKLIITVITAVIFLSVNNLFSQTIEGKITSSGDAVPFVNIVIKELKLGVSADEKGNYSFSGIPEGSYSIIASSIGMESNIRNYDIKSGVNIINIELVSSVYDLDQIVITGTKTFKRKTDSPVIVNVINSKRLEDVQACNLSEGLSFQPGVRLETDCQTCNYTQLRMNGLSGGYSQILINGRSSFSPLTGLYGMEQIPSNMIERIEVVRGGGSALYGSSAIGGVVNVITKFSDQNNYSVGYNYSKINGSSNDRVFYGNTSIISSNKKSGAVFFVNNRERMWYDHNKDNFSELPALKDNTFGSSLFFVPFKGHKIEFNIGSLHEYRYGGEMTSNPPHLAMQSEERVHDILLGNLDYSHDFNNGLGSLIVYVAGETTNRDHYTGIRPDIGTNEDQLHLLNPPYGTTLGATKQAGFQLNYNFNKLFGSNLITVGNEYISDYICDEISTYNYFLNREVTNLGAFVQSDWNFNERLNLLSGLRFDKHSLLESVVIKPRFSLLYKFPERLQFRMSYSTGFRAPQAFDADLHMSFAGGGVSRVLMDEGLKQEDSRSLSVSINYDKATEDYVYGFTFEGFHTYLDDAFYQDNVGEDEFGEVFIKRNGSGATVRGVLLELRANIDRVIQFESGFTLQESFYENPVSYSVNLYEKKEFLRSPNGYGYLLCSYMASNRFSVATNLVYTGPMDILHLAGAPNQGYDEFFRSSSFYVIGLKTTYTQKMKEIGVKLEYSVGVKNLTNSYQQEFDILKERDSNFIYGPSSPRTVFFSLVLKSI